MGEAGSRLSALGYICLRGVKVHNLQEIDLDIPHRKLVVFCGVSGSGKSSLALDTLYAEGQRRYIESFSAYTRQFLERLEKPDADRIDNIPPAIAVTGRNTSRSSQSTVGTATEATDYLRLLYAKIGHVFCQKCGREVRRDTPQSVAQMLASLPNGTRYMVAFPCDIAQETATLVERGFVRVVLADRMIDLSAVSPPLSLAGEGWGEGGQVVIDRLTAGNSTDQRTRDSLETAFTQGQGRCTVFIAGDESSVIQIDGQPWRRVGFSSQLSCADCGLEYVAPEPRLFSFNSPLGACPVCEGLGSVDSPCPACHGARLRPEALATHIAGQNIAQLCAMKIDKAAQFIRQLEIPDWEAQVGRLMIDQVKTRLGFLQAMGLGYLSLDRMLPTLSGGEARRVALTSTLGSSLVNMLYVLDEPSVGLHPHDVNQLLEVIVRLRDRGNTVVVVEHEESIIRAADQVVEIGPGAGERGGQLVFQGTPAEMEQCPESLTGDYLAGRRGISGQAKRRAAEHGWIRLSGARGNNLKNLTVEFPLGVLCLITGVSGAGKSTLVEDTLYPALCSRLHKNAAKPSNCDDVFGDGQLDDVIMVDQNPIGRSPRSNPVTYLKIFDEIRNVFAETIEARTRNYSASHFSFNIDGGRCSKCEGNGYLQIDMQFLADIYMKCPQCQGQRYRDEILDITYRGRNIAEVLEMTAREAFAFFRGQPKVQAKLKRLIDVGLDYVRLGQPANTLSGGESQRLKLAGHLSSIKRGRSLFILDEPTTGLHFSDIVQLLDCFDALLAVGHSLIVVEHNLQVMKAADYIIDIGPGAAEQGGEIVAQGTPEMIAQNPHSITGQHLAQVLDNHE